MAATINTPRKAPKQTPSTRSVPDNPVFSTNWPITKFTIAPTIRVAINSTAMELIAHGREVDEIRQIIGADGLIFQDLNDLIEAVRAENPDIQQFECSVFNGVYVTKDVDQGYLDFLDTLRNDDAKAVQRQNEVENLEMHNEG